MTLDAARLLAKPTLVYWHCDTWWPLEDGPSCPAEHDTPMSYATPRKGRKRRVWICNAGEGGIAYLSRANFLEHDEEDCHA